MFWGLPSFQLLFLVPLGSWALLFQAVGCSSAWSNRLWGNTQARQRVWLLGISMVTFATGLHEAWCHKSMFHKYLALDVPPLDQTGVWGTPTLISGFAYWDLVWLQPHSVCHEVQCAKVVGRGVWVWDVT